MKKIVCNGPISVFGNGLLLENKRDRVFICFDDCAKNYATEKGLETSKCVATRDITQLSYIFYTQPKVNVLFKRCLLKDFMYGESAVGRFLDLQKAIIKAGYTSYDLS